MRTPQDPQKIDKLKTTGRALVGVGLTGAVAFTGATVGNAAPSAQHHGHGQGHGKDPQQLLKDLMRANQDLQTLQGQLAQDRERANKALVDLQNARKHAIAAQQSAATAAAELTEAHTNLLKAQQKLNKIAAEAYRNSATTNSTLDLMSGEDPDTVIARQAIIDRAAAQQSAVVDELKQARAKNANMAAAAREAAEAAEKAKEKAISSNESAKDSLLAAQTAVRTKKLEIDRLTAERDSLIQSLQTANAETAPGDEPINREALAGALAASGDLARAVAKAPVDVRNINKVSDLAKLPVEVLQSIPPEVWERLGDNVRAQVARQSPDAAAALGVAQNAAIGAIPHLSIITDNAELLDVIPNAIKARENDGDAIVPSGTLPKRTATGDTSPGVTGSNDVSTPGASTATNQPAEPFNLSTIMLSPRAKIERVVNRGMSQLGVPYAWGGGDVNGPTQGIRDGGVADSYGDYNKVGFDCSGLMVYAFAALGYNLPHYSGYQYTSGMQIPVTQMKRGDMIFYGPGGSQHVALYLGDGMMLEAPQSGDVVKVSAVRWAGMTPFVVRMVAN